MASVGGITISSAIDLKGFEDGYKKIEIGLEKLAQKAAITFKSISNSLNAIEDNTGKQQSTTEDLTEEYRKQKEEIQEQSKIITELTVKKKELEDASKTIEDTINNQNVVYDEQNKTLENQKVEINNINVAIEEAKNKLNQITDATKNTNNEYSKSTKNIENTSAAIMKQQALVDELKAKYDLLSSLNISPKGLTDVNTELEKTKITITETNKKIQELQTFINEVEPFKEKLSAESLVDYEKAKSDLEALQNDLIQTKIKATELSTEAKQIKFGLEQPNAINNVKNDLNIAVKKLEEMKNKSSQVGKIAPKAMKETGNSAKSTTKHVGGLADSIDKTFNRIKSLLTAAFVFNVLRKAFKEFRDYVGLALTANQAFANSFAQVKGNLAIAFQPILQVVVPALATLTSWLSTVTAYLAAFISILFGKSVKASQATAKNMDKLAASTKKTGKASKDADKETKNLLGTFDEINQIAKETADALAGGADATTIAPDFSGVEDIDFSWLDGLYEKLQPTIDALSELWDTLKVIGDFAWDNLLNFYNDFLVPVGNWLLGENGLPRFINIINDMLNNIDWQKINDSLSDLYDELTDLTIFVFDSLFDFLDLFLKPLGEWVMGEAFPRFVDAITNMLAKVDWDKLNGALERMWVAVEKFAENVGEGLLWFWENVITPLIGWALDNLIPAALDLITAAIDALNVIIETAKPMLLWLWDTILVPFGKWTGQLIIDGIKWLTEKFKAFSDWASQNQSTMDLIVGTIITFLAELWIYHTTKKVIGLIIDLVPKFASLAKSLFGVYLPILLLTAGIVALALNWDKLSPAQRTITLLGSLAAAATAAAIAVALFHTSWSVGVAAAAIAAGLALIAGTKLFTGEKFSLPSFTGDTSEGGIEMPSSATTFSKYNFSTSPFPKLATGTVVPPNKEFLAILGDNKQETEIVSPLSTMKQAISEVISELGISGNDSTMTTPVVVNIDGQVLYQTFQKVSRQRGFAQPGMGAFQR